MNFKEELQQRTQGVQEIIYRYLPEETGYQKTLLEAMNYSMTSGGKRLRPLLMQETYRLFGGHEKVVEPFMAAMEMIHTHSLIHDDLPAIDNDDYRRGRKTTHIVYGEDIAILAGDALLNYAYETACQAFQIDPENVAVGKALIVLTQKTGAFGMLGGQAVDVQSEGQALEKDKLNFIYYLKTSALIEASMMVGAILAGASDEETEIIAKVAADVGLAFQIQDDILDVTSTQEVLGKPIRSDEKNEKTTYVSLEGVEKAKADVKAVSDRALANLKSLSRKHEILEELICALINRQN